MTTVQARVSPQFQQYGYVFSRYAKALRPARLDKPDAGEQSGCVATEVTIDPRFCGPAGYGNGGYCCGTFAGETKGPVEVTLRAPVQLGQPYMRVRDGETVTIRADDGSVIAQVEPAASLDDIEPPVRPSADQARAAAEGSPFRTDAHPYPGCFVCGPAHPHGLQIQVGAIPDHETVAAATFTPDDSLPSVDGALRPEVVWAALDCPSFVPSLWSDDPVLMGRLTAELLAPVPIGEEVVAVAWETGRDGRKLHSASALIDSDGQMLARARALWFRVQTKPGEHP